MYTVIVSRFRTGMDSRPGLKNEPSAGLGILESNCGTWLLPSSLPSSLSPLDLRTGRMYTVIVMGWLLPLSRLNAGIYINALYNVYTVRDGHCTP